MKIERVSLTSCYSCASSRQSSYLSRLPPRSSKECLFHLASHHSFSDRETWLNANFLINTSQLLWKKSTKASISLWKSTLDELSQWLSRACADQNTSLSSRLLERTLMPLVYSWPQKRRFSRQSRREERSRIQTVTKPARIIPSWLNTQSTHQLSVAVKAKARSTFEE